MTATPQAKTIIGNNVLVTIAGIKDIPAKVDTGADSSSVWASDLHVNHEGQLEFCLFAPQSPFYTGERIIATDFTVKQVRNSTGDVTVRYQVPLSVTIQHRRVRAKFTLADRSRNRFPVLIGRKTLQNKFLVDVSQVSVPRHSTFDNQKLAQELAADPQRFHQRYMKSQDNHEN